uniref:TSA: Wollemia nobilis Ref_Wollemi_Transcript_29740_1065 transcribed RNA sequence n=1 Tax=Wollemia nobilis TaxID=56998 RepID=A0A0C9S3C5_9CONI
MEGVKGRRILVAVDGSEQSRYALKWAVDNLHLSSSDTLVLCHVESIPVGGPGLVLTPQVAVALQKYMDRVAEDVMKKSRELCSESQVKVEEKILSGDARDGLCEAVKKFEADFLVIGSHGYGIIKRAVVGSVSDYCAHHAECPILIVKKPH